MLVSVVTAVYNGAEYLRECIASILNQTYTDFEYVIVNDGSTDETRGILDAITDKRVKVIHAAVNQGAATSLNIGIEQAQGTWIAIQDADDISRPTKLEEQMKYLEQNPSAIGVSSLIKCIPGRDNVFTDYMKSLEMNYNIQLKRDEISNARFHSCYVCHGTVVYAKEVFNRVGKYNTNYTISYDYDLWVRLFEIMPIEKIPNILYEYRVISSSLTNSQPRRVNQELLCISTHHVERLVYQKIQRKPQFIVMGTQADCDFFKKYVMPAVDIDVHAFLSVHRHVDESQAFKLVKRGKADGVIVIDGSGADYRMQSLERKGLKINENLFKVWEFWG
ncbi:glycosyltransferase [Ectobacillus antri]|uniref:Glycosyltransferase n=1 Tax=Ectobacillus antri TaxID=2486280 RepID=A0ABT6H4P5_9BACI|nr:glycosyltransferase [Ectobacillus antri]MDG4656622.1 glycosyltransferase [Ectobacillus antri]MDG5754015.1 glycosyltransferase [Ectobacillus antri]